MKHSKSRASPSYFDAPFDVILAETSVVEPDLAIIRQGRRGSLSKRGFEGAPDVVVEILSPTTRGNDVFLKKAAYARLGVAEYWIVDPDLGRIEVFRLKEGGYDQGLLFDSLCHAQFALVSRDRCPAGASFRAFVAERSGRI